MICPHCNVNFWQDWTKTHALVWNEEKRGQGIKHTACPNCGRLIIKVFEGKVDIDEQDFELSEEDELLIDYDEFTVYPNPADSELPEEIPETYKADYVEAKAVLEISPKASAAISRRLLQNLLQDKVQIKDPNLSKQIDSFLDLPNVPSHLSKSVDAIRNIGNFAAHPNKETRTGEIVNVEPGEADWLLEVLLSLFDFLFIQPKRIEKRRNELNEKLRSMGKPEMKG